MKTLIVLGSMGESIRSVFKRVLLLKWPSGDEDVFNRNGCKQDIVRNNTDMCFILVIAGLNSNTLYSLVDSADGFFSIDELTGVVSLERPLDREVQAVYELKARVSDQGSPRLSSVCQVVISVLDINDNPPVFEHREYTATLSEDVAVGTQVLRVQAASRDADANGEISYGIISGNEHGMFSVDQHTGMWHRLFGGVTIISLQSGVQFSIIPCRAS